MPEVVRVLALVRGIGLEDYRAELESWKLEENPHDRWSDEQVDAELERASRLPRFNCSVELVAVLDDGQRVGDNCPRGVEFGPFPGHPGWEPTQAEVEEAVRRSLQHSPEPFHRFEL